MVRYLTIIYVQALKSDDLIAYLDTYALPAPPKKSSSSGSSGSAKKAEPCTCFKKKNIF